VSDETLYQLHHDTAMFAMLHRRHCPNVTQNPSCTAYVIKLLIHGLSFRRYPSQWICPQNCNVSDEACSEIVCSSQLDLTKKETLISEVHNIMMQVHDDVALLSEHELAPL